MRKINTYADRAALAAALARMVSREVKHYRTDWTNYDRPAILDPAQIPDGESRIWITRESGTHLFRVDSYEFILAVIECWTPDRVTIRRLTFGPGATLEKLDPLELLNECREKLQAV